MTITRPQFQIQIDRLVNTFGANKFPDQRAAMIWDSVSDLSYPTVIAIVDTFIRNSKHAPLPCDFSDAVKEATKNTKHRYFLGEIQPPEIAQCWDCGDSGFIRLFRNDNFEEWAVWKNGSAPCHCYRGRHAIEAGKRKPKNQINLGTQFSDHWRTSYAVMPAHIHTTTTQEQK